MTETKPKYTTRLHVCISVRGMLNWNVTETKRQMKYITDDDGRPFAFGQAGAMGYMDQAMNPMMNQSMRGQTPMAGSTAKSELERLRSPAYRKAYSPRSMAQNDLMQPQLAGY